MCLRNTKEAFGAVTKFFHWSVFLFILLAYILSPEEVPEALSGAAKEAAEAAHLQDILLHKSLGGIALILVLARLLWRLAEHAPNPIPQPAWQAFLNHAVKFLLYACMILQPLTGYLMSMAGGHGAEIFGLPLPDLVGKNKNLGGVAHTIHVWMPNFFMAAVIFHAAAALYHHFILGDQVLRRMLPLGRGQNAAPGIE